MRNTSTFILILSVMILTSLFGCYKDSEHMTTVVIPDRPAIVVSGEIALSLRDESGEALNTGAVLIDGESVPLAGDPFIPLKLTAVDKRATMAMIDVPGYSSTPFQVVTESNDVSYVHRRIVMNRIEREVESSELNMLTFGSMTVNINPMGLLLGGDVFAGDANVSGFERKIETTDDLQFIPGSSTGIDREGNQGWLKVKTLLNFEAHAMSGAELTFAQSSTMITVRDDSGKPYRLTQSGDWSELDFSVEGDQIKFNIEEGGYYCLADYQAGVIVSGTVNIGGHALPHVEIRAIEDGNYISQTHTTNSGRWEMHLPASGELVLEIVTHCGEIYREEVNTGDHDDNMDFNLDGVFESFGIKGIARDCQDTPLARHFVHLIDNSSAQVLYFPTAEFNITIAACSDEIGIKCIAADWEQMGALVRWPVSGGEVDIHSTYACNETAEEYLTVRINGESKVYLITGSERSPENRLLITAEDPSQQGEELTLWIDGSSSGQYDDMFLNILYTDMDENFSQGGYSVFCPTSEEGCGFQDFEITHFGSTGEWIRGNFEGRFWVKTFDPLTAGYKDMSGEFQVYRDF